MRGHIKVRFEYYNDLFDREEVETLWAKVVDEEQGIYQLDNIPFFVQSFACGDLVKAVKLDDGFLKVTELVEASGCGTINVVFYRDTDRSVKDKILEKLNNLGVDYEGLESVVKGYYTLHIPTVEVYNSAVNLLTQEAQVLDFREACMIKN